MTHSKTHQKFSKRLKEPDALTNPAKYLGPNWEDVLNFWIYLDTLSDEKKEEMGDNYWALDFNVRVSAKIAARNAADEVVGEEFSNEAWYAACVVTKCDVFSWATDELIGGVENKVFYNLIMQNSNKSETMSPELTEQLKIYQGNLRQTAADWFDASFTAKTAGLQEFAIDFKKRELKCKQTIAIITQTIADFTSPLASEYIRNTKIVEIPTPIISKIHQKFSELINNPDALTNPKKYLGPNFEKVLDFWIYLDTLSDQDKKEMLQRYRALDGIVSISAWNAAWDAANEVVGVKFRCAAWCAACDVTGCGLVFAYATDELIGNVKNKVAYDLIMSPRP
jgi:hypothetical protein